jgi:hypothetical protein
MYGKKINSLMNTFFTKTASPVFIAAVNMNFYLYLKKLNNEELLIFIKDRRMEELSRCPLSLPYLVYLCKKWSIPEDLTEFDSGKRNAAVELLKGDIKIDGWFYLLLAGRLSWKDFQSKANEIIAESRESEFLRIVEDLTLTKLPVNFYDFVDFLYPLIEYNLLVIHGKIKRPLEFLEIAIKLKFNHRFMSKTGEKFHDFCMQTLSNVISHSSKSLADSIEKLTEIVCNFVNDLLDRNASQNSATISALSALKSAILIRKDQVTVDSLVFLALTLEQYKLSENSFRKVVLHKLTENKTSSTSLSLLTLSRCCLYLRLIGETDQEAIHKQVLLTQLNPKQIPSDLKTAVSILDVFAPLELSQDILEPLLLLISSEILQNGKNLNNLTVLGIQVHSKHRHTRNLLPLITDALTSSTEDLCISLRQAAILLQSTITSYTLTESKRYENLFFRAWPTLISAIEDNQSLIVDDVIEIVSSLVHADDENLKKLYRPHERDIVHNYLQFYVSHSALYGSLITESTLWKFLEIFEINESPRLRLDELTLKNLFISRLLQRFSDRNQLLDKNRVALLCRRICESRPKDPAEIQFPDKEFFGFYETQIIWRLHELGDLFHLLIKHLGGENYENLVIRPMLRVLCEDKEISPVVVLEVKHALEEKGIPWDSQNLVNLIN